MNELKILNNYNDHQPSIIYNGKLLSRISFITIKLFGGYFSANNFFNIKYGEHNLSDKGTTIITVEYEQPNPEDGQTSYKIVYGENKIPYLCSSNTKIPLDEVSFIYSEKMVLAKGSQIDILIKLHCGVLLRP